MALYEIIVQPLEFDFRAATGIRKWGKFPGLVTANIPFSSAPKFIPRPNTKYANLCFYPPMHQWGQDLRTSCYNTYRTWLLGSLIGNGQMEEWIET